MKKWTIGAITVFFLLAFCSPNFAMLRKDMEAIKGKVVAVDHTKKEIIVKDDATGQDKTFNVRKGIDPSLKTATAVTVIYKKGSNQATSVVPRRRM